MIWLLKTGWMFGLQNETVRYVLVCLLFVQAGRQTQVQQVIQGYVSFNKPNGGSTNRMGVTKSTPRIRSELIYKRGGGM